MKKTFLYAKHKELQAKFTEFFGWQMPLQYESIIAEHKNTRTNVGVFDVSHMGQIEVVGVKALDFLQKVTCNDVSSLQIGQVQYSLMLNDAGAVIDDLTIYRLEKQKFMLCINASNIDKDYQWLVEHSKKYGGLICNNVSNNYSLIAVQGPKALELLSQLANDDIQQIKYYWFKQVKLCGAECLVARMGYTGEDGCEIYCNPKDSVNIWQAIFDTKNYQVKPAGLGARDTLRLEACFALYGNDLDETHTALEANMGWLIKFDKGDFIGKQALLKQKEKGISTKLCSFIAVEKGIPRKGYSLFSVDHKNIGTVTSGTSSPILSTGIGMGYVMKEYSKIGTKILVQSRADKYFLVEIVKPPFIKKKN